MAEAFVYCWTDHKTNKLYVGSHKGSLNDGYVCSSKVMLEEYNKRPCDFTRQIIAEGSWDDMFKFEGVLLRAFDVKNCDDFYNMHNGSGDFRNKGLSEESRKKISKSKTGITSPKKGIPSNISPWNKGKTAKDDERIKKYAETLSEKNKGKIGYWKDKKIPTHVKQNLSDVNKKNNNAGKKILTPYGMFDSTAKAARDLNMTYQEVRNLVSKNEDWKRIT